MSTIPPRVRSLIESGRLTHLVTINPDGSPQASAIWIGLEGDEIVSGHLGEHRKLVNIRRDPRLVLTLEAGTRTEIGLDEYLVIHGTGRVTDGGAPELLQRLAHVYLGPDVVFPPMPNPPAGYVLRITPDRFGGVGPWSD
ncbi:MAG: PPOX class F420-dependent oxidoreductase [Acidimicrobiia bacterium]